MPSVTSWLRLEGNSSDVYMDLGLQARIHDPLWMLGRQWQVNEFLGEDAGSPVKANLKATLIGLTSYTGGPAQNNAAHSQPYDARTMPLETIVEHEEMAVGDEVDLRFAAETGNEFLRLLDNHDAGQYRPAFLDHYKFVAPADADAQAKLDAESLSWSLLVAQKAIDGARLYQAFAAALRPAAGTPDLPPEPATQPADHERVLTAAQTWLAWYESLVSHNPPGASAWLDDRMEYSFSVSAAMPEGELVFVAPEYSEGELDWYSFVVTGGASPGSAQGEPHIEQIVRETIPAPVRFPGMPAERWWEFEDGNVDFGSVETSPWDAISMVQLQFAVVYGTDWFVIPLQMNVGNLCWIQELVVTDTFGEVTTIPRFDQAGGAESGWGMFELNIQGEPSSEFAQLFFLPPTFGSSFNSAPIEQVSLVRDEMANVAWGIEKVVPSRIGQPINRRDEFFAKHAQIAAAPPPQQSEGHTRVDYKLASHVPDYWIPFLPVRNEKNALLLRRGTTTSISRDSSPHGRILRPERLAIHDEEIPRTGVEVTRAFQYARWIDGSTHLWLARRKNLGRGEASSGLRFDIIAPGNDDS